MRVTQVRVGRTYNTLMYTSQRFEMEADIEDDEDCEAVIAALAHDLHAMACNVMRDEGVRTIQEQSGAVSIVMGALREEGDTDDIPF